MFKGHGNLARILFLLLISPIIGATRPPLINTFYNKLHQLCPAISSNAIITAINVYQHARRYGLDHRNLITIVDFTKPSGQKRLCTMDMAKQKVLFSALVAHGKQSGFRFAKSFSNAINSHESSIGVYLTGKSYHGVFGYALRVYGLDHKINDHAAKRNIVIHSANYVSMKIAKIYQRVGRTWGCFAINPKLIYPFIDTIKEGTLIVAYYPNANWLQHSIFLHNLPIETAQKSIIHEIKLQLSHYH